MKRERNAFTRLCAFTQPELKEYCYARIAKRYGDVISKDGYILAHGNAPVMLTAHLDTVHKKPVKSVTYSRGKLASPQGIGGDDRCGVYIILSLIDTLPDKHLPHILLCEDEEIGGVGSNKFVSDDIAPDLALKHIIELDRKGSTEAVYYDCNNAAYKAYIESITGYTEEWGSFSDICNLSPYYDIASVNLSVGYYHAHTLNEYVMITEMIHTRSVVEKLVRDSHSCKKYAYDPAQRWRSVPSYASYGYNYNYADFGDYGALSPSYGYSHAYGTDEYEILATRKGGTVYEVIEAISYDEAIGKFLQFYGDITYEAVTYCEPLYATYTYTGRRA